MTILKPPVRGPSTAVFKLVEVLYLNIQNWLVKGGGVAARLQVICPPSTLLNLLVISSWLRASAASLSTPATCLNSGANSSNIKRHRTILCEGRL